MLFQAVLLGSAMLVPHQYVYGGKSLDTIRCIVKCLHIDFDDRTLNRVFDCKDKEFESIRIRATFNSVTVSTVRIGTWPPHVRPLVTVYRGHPDFKTLHHLILVKKAIP